MFDEDRGGVELFINRTIRFTVIVSLGAVMTTLPSRVYAEIGSFAKQSTSRVENAIWAWSQEVWTAFNTGFLVGEETAKQSLNEDSARPPEGGTQVLLAEVEIDGALQTKKASTENVVTTELVKVSDDLSPVADIPKKNPELRTVSLPPGTLENGRTVPIAESRLPAGASVIVNTALTFSRSQFEGVTGESRFDEAALNFEPIIRHEGLGGLTFKTDLRLVWRENSDSVFTLDDQNDGFQFERGRTTLTKDLPASALRLELGDILTKPVNFQTTEQLLGIRLGTEHREIHPYKTIYPGGRQTFQIDRRSRVQVFADGALVGQQVLQPGQFDVEQFATEYGTRNIELGIRDDTGQSVRIDFPTASAIPRLNKGVMDYSFAGGFASEYTFAGPEYEFDDYRAVGFFDYGVSDQITLGVDYQAHPDAQALGARSVFATSIGDFQTRMSASLDSSEEDIAVGIQYASLQQQDGLRVKVGFEYYGDDYPDFRAMNSTLGGIGYSLENPKYEVDLALSDQVGKKLSYTIGGNWRRNHRSLAGAAFLSNEEQWTGYLSSNYKLFRNWSASLSLSANNYNQNEETNFGALISLRRKFGTEKQAEVAYASRSSAVSASLSSDPFSTVNRASWQVRGEYAQRPQELAGYSADVDFTGTHFGVYGLVFEDQELETKTEIRDIFLQAETAFAAVDGEWAIGRPVRSSGFAIVKNSRSEGSEPIFVDDWGPGDFRGRAGPGGKALLGDLLPYTNVELEFSQRPAQASGASEDPFLEASEILGEELVYTYPYAGVVLDLQDPADRNQEGAEDASRRVEPEQGQADQTTVSRLGDECHWPHPRKRILNKAIF